MYTVGLSGRHSHTHAHIHTRTHTNTHTHTHRSTLTHTHTYSDAPRHKRACICHSEPCVYPVGTQGRTQSRTDRRTRARAYAYSLRLYFHLCVSLSRACSIYKYCHQSTPRGTVGAPSVRCGTARVCARARACLCACVYVQRGCTGTPVVQRGPAVFIDRRRHADGHVCFCGQFSRFAHVPQAPPISS